tara:strand:+ start:136 stop:735 length:600 start_codon:yes stop_codon:yes gene_type:complete
MKRLLAYLFLILVLIFSFQSWTKADDIRDFEIEGMSIGDSLLDFVSKSEIKKTYFTGTNSKKFVSSYNVGNSKIYDGIQFHYKSLDKKFILYGISGIIEYSNKNIEKCYKKISEIYSEIEIMFPNAETEKDLLYDHPTDKSGDSKVFQHDFVLNDGSQIKLQCTKWSKKLQSKHNWFSNLRIAVTSKEFMDWLDEIYYN